MALVAPNGRWLRVNRALCDIIGYSEKELLARDCHSVTHPDDQEADDRFMGALLDGTIPCFQAEKRYLHKTGHVVWILLSGSLVRDAEGKPLYFIGQMQDITQRKQIEDQLRESEERFRNAFEFAAIGMALAAPDGRWLRVNRALCDLVGYSEAELLALDFQSITHPGDLAADLVYMRGLLEGSISHCQYEKRYLHKSGRVVWILLSGSLVRDGAGAPLYFIGQMQDITQRKEAVETLQEYNQRLKALSHQILQTQETERRRLARELHDEIGQMLTTVGMRLHQLKSKWAVDLRAKGGEKSQILSALDEDIEFVNRTIEQVREMSLNLRPPMLDILGLEATLRWHAENQSQRTGLDIRIEGHLDEKRLPADLEIACFRIVQETLTNVVRHARAKHVCIELRREEHELLLIVSDDGVGFDVQAVQSRAGRGGSFGVLAMRERAELLGGRIDIESAPGRGTRVCARFPMG